MTKKKLVQKKKWLVRAKAISGGMGASDWTGSWRGLLRPVLMMRLTFLGIGKKKSTALTDNHPKVNLLLSKCGFWPTISDLGSKCKIFLWEKGKRSRKCLEKEIKAL